MSNTIEVGASGPYHAEASVAGAPAAEVWLCRCGASQTKPFCDGSHRAAGFDDPATYAVGVLGDVTFAALTVSPLPNGPLLLVGGVEVKDATGTVILRAERAALCRCGASTKKPFCDATHRKSGFIAP